MVRGMALARVHRHIQLVYRRTLSAFEHQREHHHLQDQYDGGHHQP
ncbi:hypothetical protein PPTG_22039 [Phytophthora nicotianae INRA-310]|uniref:Uncharacterized protein n=1 Tax=Phytophthora nicotianae (strain INRA-310) TaxID=761204 RepID=W2QP94_PHYN3|nr:hypothetical protein PPTG_22039 [Phytophthora nicotianae INRA-310]ETN14933.1 hypothetical protein PPTG_22039 [Phytophthora nicotianae INRA-310]